MNVELENWLLYLISDALRVGEAGWDIIDYKATRDCSRRGGLSGTQAILSTFEQVNKCDAIASRPSVCGYSVL